MRLIDVDALKIEIACLHGSDYQTIHYLNHAPTVDAVPVVRCKDCVFNHGGECWGFGDGHLVCDDDYCSGAERKEE